MRPGLPDVAAARFALRERLALECVIEVDLVLQDHVDRAGDLLLDEGASDAGFFCRAFF